MAFALGMIGTGLLAIPILSGSAAYAVKEFMGWKGALSTKPQYRPTFYGLIALATLGGLAMNFLHIDAIRALFWTAVINGLVAPPLMILIVLLGSDREFMAEHVSGWVSKALTWAGTIAMSAAAIGLVIMTFVIRWRAGGVCAHLRLVPSTYARSHPNRSSRTNAESGFRRPLGRLSSAG